LISSPPVSPPPIPALAAALAAVFHVMWNWLLCDAAPFSELEMTWSARHLQSTSRATGDARACTLRLSVSLDLFRLYKL
jgi:hypothetical protein